MPTFQNKRFVCGCGKIFYSSGHKFVNGPRCRSCCNAANSSLHKGPKSNTWKGGNKHWQAGKVGRDKDGLSWKHQRQLAWDRDQYTCQHCGKHPIIENPSWKPDVHHVVPYRLSFSHALTNLLCLCRSCHKKAEAQIKELWGGYSLGQFLNMAVSANGRPAPFQGENRGPIPLTATKPL